MGFAITSIKCNFFLVFNWNNDLLTNSGSVQILLPKCSFHTLLMHTEIDHKAVHYQSRTTIIDKSLCHSYSETTLHRVVVLNSCTKFAGKHLWRRLRQIDFPVNFAQFLKTLFIEQLWVHFSFVILASL